MDAAFFLESHLMSSLSHTYLGGIDQLVGQALGDGLDVAECGFTGSSAEQPDCLVDASQGRNIDGLTTNGTGTTNTGRVFTWTRVDDSGDQDLQRVLVCQKVDDLESVLHDADGHQLLTIVASLHHERVCETLDDWALGLAETLHGETSGGVGKIASILLLHGDVILKQEENCISGCQERIGGYSEITSRGCCVAFRFSIRE